jgi:tRNA threonylcarbamoyladenosine biosynthesis protein TsaB
MLLLAIETSSPRGSLALFRDRRLIAESHFPEGLVHGREITAHLDSMMTSLRLAPGDLGAVAVGIGPGSYTGVRVGVTSAKTLAFALRIPIIPISSLKVVAAGALLPGGGGARVVTAVDGKQRHVYLARFRVEDAAGGDVINEVTERVLAIPPRKAGAEAGIPSLAEEAVQKALAEVLDPGSMVVGDAADVVMEIAAPAGVARGPREHDWPRAAVLASLAMKAAAQHPPPFDLEAVHQLIPVYLRDTEAERKIGRC